MTENLLESLKGYITPDLISKASSMLGESEGGITKGIAAVFPTLLSGLLNKTGDSGAMGSIMSLISDNQSSSAGVLSNVAGLLSSNSAASGVGASLLGTLFGNNQSKITDLISNVSGIKGSSASSLMGLAAPLLVSHFAKSNTSLSGLTSLLSSQKSNILAAAPLGLSSMAGFANMFGGDLKNAASNVTSSTEGGSGFPKWLLPLLLIGAAIAALFFFTKGCEKKELNTTEITTAIDSAKTDVANAVDSTATAVSDATTATIDALGKFFALKLPNGIELNVPELGIENKLATWVGDKTKMVDKTTWFNFDRLLFDTDKSTLHASSQEQLKNIAEIMKAYPTMEIKIGGYTDNTGDAKANVKLSDARAKTVKDELVKLGVAANRLAAEGYGDQFPVASNDTEEGRAQNRRIAVRVTKK